MIDSHTHSIHSHDGLTTIKALVKRADSLKLEYLAVTEHLDKDYRYGKLEKLCRQLNLDCYEKAFENVKKGYEGKVFLAFGIECGYDKRLEKTYADIIEKYDFDVVINSVHTLDGVEAYYGDMFKNKTQDEVYNAYLDTLTNSVYAAYDCNIIAHIGYITRYAKYDNVLLYQPKYRKKTDDLLSAIIEKDKTIEINTHISKNGMEFLPEADIIRRYKELGGKNITFSSDAHKAKYVADKYRTVADFVKDSGFKEWTVYKKRKPYKIEID